MLHASSNARFLADVIAQDFSNLIMIEICVYMGVCLCVCGFVCLKKKLKTDSRSTTRFFLRGSKHTLFWCAFPFLFELFKHLVLTYALTDFARKYILHTAACTHIVWEVHHHGRRLSRSIKPNSTNRTSFDGRPKKHIH